ncbi:MAG: PAC2 family protein, partial [Acidobacteria bacterium]|nr:PAC2 family protein [Acidobacteriota bacterium]
RGTPVLLLTGPEPDSQWRAFAAAVAELATRLGVYQMVAFGAYPFATPHTRPSRLACTSPSADVVSSVPYQRSTLDVPAGMSAVLEHALTEAGIASLGLWVQVPHYVSAMPYPAASAALVDALRDTTGIDVDTSTVQVEATTQSARIEELVQGNDEHVAMVRQLETAYDMLPTGDELAAQFEQFLRDQGE